MNTEVLSSALGGKTSIAMPQRILFISPDLVDNRAITASLQAQGFALQSTDRLVSPQKMPQPPALCLIDLQIQDDLIPGELDAWLNDCKTAHSACLAFNRDLTPERSRFSLLEPLCDILVNPDDPIELRSRLTSLLTIRKLQRQLDDTRHKLAKHQADMHEALHSAAQIQRSMIPARCPTYYNLHYAWHFMPCKKVGGDLFNVLQLDEQTVMTYLVDVSGHGISAAMVTVSVHQSLSMHTGQIIKRVIDHEPFYEIASPRKVLIELEREYPFERFEEFFTISYLLINPHTGVLSYANAGHPPPLLLRQNGQVERLDQGGTVIGIGPLLEITEGSTRMQPGDRLFLYTDGITEHVNAYGQPFGEGRLVENLTTNRFGTLAAACEQVAQSLQKFGGEPPGDDVTLLGIEFALQPSTGMPASTEGD
jgi:sigma-B regulation protein RsbU (phosphoserine phosphatase)